MRRVIIIIIILCLFLSCTDFVTISGEVIEKQYVPDSGFMAPPEAWRVILRTDNGIKIMRGIEVYYDLQIGDKIEYTYDRNYNSSKSTYRVIK